MCSFPCLRHHCEHQKNPRPRRSHCTYSRSSLSSTTYTQTMSLVSGYIGLIGVGAGLPALALVAGYPKTVTDGLGSPIESWNKSKESKLGLYLYTVSDLLLAGLCTLSYACPHIATPTTALTAIACHQDGYLAAAIPAFGFRKEHIPSIIAGTISAGWALHIYRE